MLIVLIAELRIEAQTRSQDGPLERRCQMPLLAQRLKRLHTVFQGPKSRWAIRNRQLSANSVKHSECREDSDHREASQGQIQPATALASSHTLL